MAYICFGDGVMKIILGILAMMILSAIGAYTMYGWLLL